MIRSPLILCFAFVLLTAIAGAADEAAIAAFQEERENLFEDDALPDAFFDDVEFRSVFSLNGETWFSLHSPGLDLGFWLAAGESFLGLEVGEFIAAQNRLVLIRDDLVYELGLTPARVSELTDQAAAVTRQERAAAREARAERRQEARRQLRDFRSTWLEATANSVELQNFDTAARDMMRDLRDLRAARREAERGSEERRELRELEREMWREFGMAAEYASLHVSADPAFQEFADSGNPGRLVRRMMFTRSWRNHSYD